MSTPPATPTSVGSLRRFGNLQSRTFQISKEATATNHYDLDHESEPELDRGRLFTGTPPTLSHTSSYPHTSCFPSTYYRDSISNRTSTTSSSRTLTSPSILISPPQTPLGLHPTSFPAVPSPLCLGPSLCRTHPENDLEDVCLDKSCDDGNNIGEDGLPELLTPQASCFPSTYYCDPISSRTSSTSSSRTLMPSILISPPQTPLGLHPTSFPAVPSPLCLGPSLCRTHPENDLEDICLDKSCDDGNSVLGEHDELPELVTPISSPIPPSHPPSLYLNIGDTVDNHDHGRGLSNARSRATTVPMNAVADDRAIGLSW